MLTCLWFWFLTILGFDPRGLFAFFDGRRWRRVDPLEITRAFFTHPKFDWDETPNLLAGGNAFEQAHVLGQIARATREVFGIKEASAGGLTDQECFTLFGRFRQYMGDVKKNGKLFPTSSDSRESESTAWEDLPNPTRPGGVYSSTPSEQSAAPPGSPAVPTSA